MLVLVNIIFIILKDLTLKARGVLKSTPSDLFQKNRASTQNEINALLYSKHESLPSLALNYIHDANILIVYR